jgi:hypothetical protein
VEGGGPTLGLLAPTPSRSVLECGGRANAAQRSWRRHRSWCVVSRQKTQGQGRGHGVESGVDAAELQDTPIAVRRRLRPRSRYQDRWSGKNDQGSSTNPSFVECRYLTPLRIPSRSVLECGGRANAAQRSWRRHRSWCVVSRQKTQGQGRGHGVESGVDAAALQDTPIAVRRRLRPRSRYQDRWSGKNDQGSSTNPSFVECRYLTPLRI